MSLPTLNASLMVGIPSIDAEHLELIARLDSVLSDPHAHPDSDAFSEYLSKLGHLLVSHFTHEEKLLVATGMPADEISEHIHVHGEILEQYTQLNFDLMQGKAYDKISVLTMIKDWIVTHVICYDLKIRDYLSETASTPP